MPLALLSDYPPALIDGVARDASWDADAVIEFLRLVEAKSGEVWERPVLFPPAFLLGLGAALRLASWENAGLTPHTDAGLMDARETLRQVVQWSLELSTGALNQRVRELCVNVLRISVTGLAWHAREILSVPVLLADIEDEDALLEAIAELAWQHRKEVGDAAS